MRNSHSRRKNEQQRRLVAALVLVVLVIKHIQRRHMAHYLSVGICVGVGMGVGCGSHDCVDADVNKQEKV